MSLIDQRKKLSKRLEVLIHELEQIEDATVLHYADYGDPKEVRRLLKARRRRDRFLDPTLFGEPAWDMLLELYASHLEGRMITVTSLCAAAGVPATTALRWIRVLEDKELVSRKPHRHDKRIYLVDLTANGLSCMQAYFGVNAAGTKADRDLPRLPRLEN